MCRRMPTRKCSRPSTPRCSGNSSACAILQRAGSLSARWSAKNIAPNLRDEPVVLTCPACPVPAAARRTAFRECAGFSTAGQQDAALPSLVAGALAELDWDVHLLAAAIDGQRYGVAGTL